MEIEGRILFFNTQTGHGNLILKSEEKSNFFVDVWDDFNSAPESGTLVKCIIEDGVIKSIKALHVNVPAKQNSPQETNEPQKTSNTKVLLSTSEEQDATYGINQTLKNYFSPIKQIIGKPPKILKTEEKLDYFLSKRFLFTAYNNLKGIDSTLYDNKEVKESSDLLHKLDKAYSSITDKIDVPSIAFEIIFLNSQPEYIKYISDKERFLDRMSTLTNIVDSISVELKTKETQLKKITNPKIKKELESKLKKLRGSNVDTIHEKASLKEKLAAMIDIKDIYTKKYFQSFKSELSLLKVEYKKMLLNILNYKAYELDKMIWKHARKSKSVQGYFNNASIKGGYSTITYLRYYLQSLDKEKLKEEQEDLFKLLAYLQK